MINRNTLDHKMILFLANIRENCHARCVLFALIFMRALFFVKNVHTRISLRAYKIRKIPSLVDFHGLLHSQVYHNGLKL